MNLDTTLTVPPQVMSRLVGDETVLLDLAGYYLTDDAGAPTKWRFPRVELAPNVFLVVFADGKAIKGELTGVDTYELFVKQVNGLEVMINKGAVKYVHAATAE